MTTRRRFEDGRAKSSIGGGGRPPLWLADVIIYRSSRYVIVERPDILYDSIVNSVYLTAESERIVFAVPIDMYI